MNRVIKFEIMFTVHNRDFTKSIAKTYTTLDMLIDGNDDTDYNEIDIIARRQFTGLTDKNGVDIYEGDICVTTYGEDKSIESQVKYCRLYLSFWLFELCEPVSDYTGFEESIEVIGNIHENKELLNN